MIWQTSGSFQREHIIRAPSKASSKHTVSNTIVSGHKVVTICQVLRTLALCIVVTCKVALRLGSSVVSTVESQYLR